MVEIKAARFQSFRISQKIRSRMAAALKETNRDLYPAEMLTSDRLNTSKARIGYKAKMKGCKG